MFNNTWEGIKAWFLHAETIFLARLEVFIGVIVGAVGAFDWSPLTSLGMGTTFTKGQVLFLGGMMAFKGLITELARRHNDPILALQAAPDTPAVEKAKAQVAVIAKKAEETVAKAEG